MAKTYVRLTTRIDTWKDEFNNLTNDVGDIALLTTGDNVGGDSDLVHAINELDSDIGARPHTNLTTATKTLTAAINEHDAELGTITSVAMGTTASTVSTAIAELDGRLDSINDTLISSPELYISDSATTNTIKGNLNTHGNTNIGGNVDIAGNLQVDGTLTVDGVVNFKAGSNGSVTLGDANTDNVVFNADVNSNVIPNTNNAFNLGSSSQQWKHLWVTGDGNIDHLVSDSADITGSLAVGTNATVGGTLGVTGIVTANAGVKVDNITIDGTEIDLSSGSLTIDVAGDINLDADGGDVILKDAGVTYGSLTNNSGNLIIKSGTTSSVTFSGADATFASAVTVTDSASIGGSLDVTGSAGINGNFDINTNKFTVASATGNTAIAGTLGVTGAVTANAGVNVDNINIDGTTINLSSGSLTVSAATDIYLKPTGDDVFMQGVTSGEQLQFTLGTTVQTIAASDALTLTGSTFTVDASGDINLDADGGDVILKDAGTEFGRTTNDGGQLKLSSQNGQWMKFTGSGVRFSGIIADSDLTTTAKSVVSSINELKQTLDILDSASGANTDLLFANLGDLNNLNTADKTSAVAAINELHDGLDSDARKAFSATTSGTGYGGLTYDNGTGVFTYAKVTDADIRGRFTGGNAITYTSASGTIAVTSNAIQADELAVTGNGTAGQALISDGDGTFSWGRKVPNIYDSDGTLLN